MQTRCRHVEINLLNVNAAFIYYKGDDSCPSPEIASEVLRADGAGTSRKKSDVLTVDELNLRLLSALVQLQDKVIK